MTARKIIAIIDDESDIVQLFSDSLRAEGFKTIGFSDPLAAAEYIASHHSDFSLVLTDWRMPKMTGIELTGLISRIDSDIKVILMSAYELDQDELREIQKDDYLKKPIHVAKLVEAVKSQLYSERIIETI
jgi:CheY-like chemotaxis protein